MKNTYWLVFILVFCISCGTKAQSGSSTGQQPVKTGPFVGYDKVEWGSSVSRVREIYNIPNEIVLQPHGSNNNFFQLTQENVTNTIAKRVFDFRKDVSDADYILCGVSVSYVEEEGSNNNGQALMDLLTSKYGRASSSQQGGPKSSGAFGGVTSSRTDEFIFEYYFPDIGVKFQNTITITAASLWGMSSQTVRYSNWVDYYWGRVFASSLRRNNLDL